MFNIYFGNMFLITLERGANACFCFLRRDHLTFLLLTRILIIQIRQELLVPCILEGGGGGYLWLTR